MSEDRKGAFKAFPIEQQPERIPLSIVESLEKEVFTRFSDLGDLYHTNTVAKAKKDTVGDIDIIIVPKNKNWKHEIRNNPHVIANIGSSKQLMTVMRDLIGYDGKNYMIDFLICKKAQLEFKQLFYSYGTAFSAILGSFARSIGYKFTDVALFKRVKDNRGQWHNVKLTEDPYTALTLLGLHPNFVNTKEIFTVEGIANWITASPRFDTHMWKYGNIDKIAVGIPLNKNARDAIKKKEDVRQVYQMINDVSRDAEVVAPWWYERKCLGDIFIEKIIEDINKVKRDSYIILNGQEIMDLLKIKPGPKIGEYQKYLSQQFADVHIDQKQSYDIKEQAKTLLLHLHNL